MLFFCSQLCLTQLNVQNHILWQRVRHLRCIPARVCFVFGEDDKITQKHISQFNSCSGTNLHKYSHFILLPLIMRHHRTAHRLGVGSPRGMEVDNTNRVINPFVGQRDGVSKEVVGQSSKNIYLFTLLVKSDLNKT